MPALATTDYSAIDISGAWHRAVRTFFALQPKEHYAHGSDPSGIMKANKRLKLSSYKRVFIIKFLNLSDE